MPPAGGQETLVAERSVNAPLFDVASHARRGPGRRDRLTPTQVEQIRRTVGRAPEVMVKVLTRGAVTTANVRRHAEYIGRRGDVDVEMDDGQRLNGGEVGERLVEDWDLDLPAAGSAERVARGGGREPRLVHKLIFSMPAGTPPDKVLGAVRNLAREEFAMQHRYALALHTDEPHPHVHVMVKAMSEQGKRLNIDTATLRHWRAEFARHLREQGVEANATERAVRGQSRKALKDPIYRAHERGASTHVQARLEALGEQQGNPTPVSAASLERLRMTNQQVVEGYRAIADALLDQGEQTLSEQVRRFATRIERPRTEQELDRTRLRERDRVPSVDRTR
jgi:hypothetical protein